MELEKVTNGDSAAAKRRYDDACGTAHGLDLIGERWALLVVREMLLGPKRFSDLRADLPGSAPMS
jgi:DNA-binding HxlR family transcriptional regulator